MANRQKKAAKAAVQSTKLNQMPVPGVADTEFSAEEAATAFEKNQASRNSLKNQE